MGDRIRRYAVRGFAVLFCLAALADLRPFSGLLETLPVAVVDVSASLGRGGARLPEGLHVRPHWVLVADGFQDVVGEAEAARLGRGETRIGAALRHVAETRPGADVLLFTDGRDTDGDAVAGAQRLAAGGGRVFVAPPARPPADVGLLGARLLAGAPVARIEVRVGSSTSGAGELRLSRGGRIVDRRDLTFGPDEEQRIELVDPAAPPEGGTYQVVLLPDAGTPDDDPGDDRLSLGLRPERRVILAWGLGAQTGLLSAPGFVVRSVAESGAGADLSGLASADCLVLSNLPWRDMGTVAARAIERFVASGGSLLILGGHDAYAGGGWAGTRFEERLAALRVPRQEGTGLALVLALDRSGSTAGATLAHFQEAARRALQGITPGERMALLTFAGRPAAALEPPGVVGPAQPDRLRILLEALDGLEAGGDTDLPAAIRAAGARVAGIEARERRVLLLTDGDPDHPPAESELRSAARFLRERGIGFGALVVGDPAAVKLLRATVAETPEDVRALVDPQDLPMYLLHVLGGLRNRKAILPRPARIVAAPDAALPFELGGFLPRKLQRLEVAFEQGASAVAYAEYDDLRVGSVPFAAERRVGAGTSAAFAWGPVFESLMERAAALERVRPWVQRLASSADRGLAADVEGGFLIVRYPAAAGAGGLRARGVVGSTQLVETAPGVFRGPLPQRPAEGVWVSPGSLSAGPAGLQDERPLRLPARPPAESRGIGLDETRMAAIAAAGGGRRLGAGEQPPRPARDPGLPLAPWLLLGACILLVLDRVWSKPLGSMTDS